jgi:hypothetical protein
MSKTTDIAALPQQTTLARPDANLSDAIHASDAPLAADVRAANETKADLKARTTVRSTLAVAVAVTDIESWLASNPNASGRERRVAERARDAFRRKLGEK